MVAQSTGKGKKRLSRREMKEDRLIATAQKVERFYDQNRNLVWAGAAIILVAVVAVFLIRANMRRSFEEASLDLTVAKLMFQAGRIAEAEPQFQAIRERHGGRIAGEAQFYLARTAFMRGDEAAAEAAFREYVDNYHIDRYLDVAAIAGLAASMEAQGKYAEAAETYMSIPRQYRKHYYSPEAMFQAARCYLWADQKDKAVETYLLLQRQYPSSTLKTKASRAVAQIQ
jgi:TolA-binding protein